MSLPRIIVIGSVTLFAILGTVAIVKKMRGQQGEELAKAPVLQLETPPPAPKKTPLPATQPVQQAPVLAQKMNVVVEKTGDLISAEDLASRTSSVVPPSEVNDDDFPQVDRIHQLFNTSGNKLPIVETISYTSRVDWLKGRPAWIADYAAHYATSRHFIARSLNARADYFTQKVSTASRFNVFRRDKDIQFYLLIDVSRCKMGLYYLDVATNERVLLKTYPVGLGRIDPHSSSGCLTPLGTYSLGSKIAIYKPGVIGQFLNKPVEMIRVFGTRWIPFEQGFEGCTASARGYGLHGAPFQDEFSTGEIIENRTCIGKYDSDGCVRLLSEHIEEIFAVVVTKPAFVVIVKDFHQAKLPGVEVATPTR